jgi:hypothetical protein
MKRLLLVLFLSALALAAADANVTGTWAGTAVLIGPDGQSRNSGAVMVFKQDGATLNGTAGPSEDRQVPIDKGKVEGAKVSFEVSADDATFLFTMVLEKDQLKGEATGSQGGVPLKVKIELAKR